MPKQAVNLNLNENKKANKAPRRGSVIVRVTAPGIVEFVNLQAANSEPSSYSISIPKRKSGIPTKMPLPVADVLFRAAPLKMRRNPGILDQIEQQITGQVLPNIKNSR